MKFNLFNYTITIKKKKQRKKKINLKPKVWIPPTSIDAPSPPRGYVHRWVRAEAIDFSTNKKIKLRKGYELVKAKKGYPEIEEGRFKGHIGVGGLILAKIPTSIFKERMRYYERKNK